MLLSELQEGIIIGEDIEFFGITFNSNFVKKGDIFIALVGTRDGNLYVNDAIKRGAVAVVSEKELEIDVPLLLVKNARKALSNICAKFYHNVYKKLKIIAVTGTNGKTTTTHFIEKILTQAGYKVGLIGSTFIKYAEKFIESTLTTPDPPDLHKLFFDMYNAGVEYVVMEASAHALALDKLYNLEFEVGVFTNFSEDHLDYFQNMENYKTAKIKLFNMCKNVVVNIDDSIGEEIMNDCKCKKLSYSIYNEESDKRAINIHFDVGGSTYSIFDNGEYRNIRTCLIGKFNIYNSLAAYTCARILKINVNYIIDGIKNLIKVPGRFDIINGKFFYVIIDYAHTPDGLKNVLIAAKELTKKRLIIVFGCGGERDALKRPLMGKIAFENADFVIVTSDNPRNENPDTIIKQILGGISNTKNCLSISNRKKAIIKAIELAQKGDTVLVCGKGAEAYQEIKNEKIPFCDEELVKIIMNEKNL